MTANPSAPAVAAQARRKPRFALAIATVLGVGYIPKAPGTFGSIAGLILAFFSAVFFLHPASLSDVFSMHPLSDTILRENLFGPKGPNIHNVMLVFPLFIAGASFVLLSTLGVWSASRAAEYAGIRDPQYVVADEVAGQHLALVLPLIPIALPHVGTHLDFSEYTIYFALSLANWKYLLMGLLLFRIFDIWKPWPVRQLENLPRGWGIMADDWMAGVYAAILLRVALHFNLV
jgi:phosphatidylglycerophosphatase A